MNKYLIAGIATMTSVIAVSGLTYAGNSFSIGKMGSNNSGSGRVMEMRTGKMGSGRVMENIFTNSGVIAAIQAKGLTVPTETEMQVFHTAQETMMSGAMNLSDANKTELKTLRDTFQKQERDFLRSKWVVTPTEEQVTKMNTIHEIVRSTLGEKDGKNRMEERGRGSGKRDGKMMEGMGNMGMRGNR